MKRILSIGLVISGVLSSQGLGLSGPSISANGSGLGKVITTNNFNVYAPGLIIEVSGVTNYIQVNGIYTNSYVVDTNVSCSVFRSIDGFTNEVYYDTNNQLMGVRGTVLQQEFLSPEQEPVQGRVIMLDLNSGANNGFIQGKPWTNGTVPHPSINTGTEPSGGTVSWFPKNFPPLIPVHTWVVGDNPIAAIVNEDGSCARFVNYGHIPINYNTNGGYNVLRLTSILLNSNNVPQQDRVIIFQGKIQMQADGNFEPWAIMYTTISPYAKVGDNNYSMSWSGYGTVLAGALGDPADSMFYAAKAHARLQIRGQGVSRPAFLIEPGSLCTAQTNGAVEYDNTNIMDTVRNVRIPSLLGQAGHTNGIVAATSLTIVFNYAMPDTNYVPELIGSAAISAPLITAQTTTSFTTSMGAFTGNLRWSVTEETQKN